MPRSSRSKSHKQSKHSSKDAAGRDYSGSDEDVKVKERSSNGGKEDVVSVRSSKDSSVPGEKRKHGKDLSNSHGNGAVSEKSHGVSDRWNGGGSDDKGLVINIDDSSRGVGETKRKDSRRHGSDGVSLIASEKDESKSGSGNRGEKRKSERESSRKESSQYKEHKESKDKDRVSDRGRKVHSDKLEAEPSSKQVENQNQLSKRVKEVTEWPIEEELRNPELEKELEKRMRRRGEVSSNKEKYRDDIKETEDKLPTRNDHSKDERHKAEEYVDIVGTHKKDEKHREDGERDRKSRDSKHRSESGRHSKHRDDKYHEDKYREDGNKETKYKDDKHMEISDKDERSRNRKRRQDDDDDRDYKHKEEKRVRDSKYRDLPETKRVRDDKVGTDLYHRNNRDGSPGHDDRAARYKDDKDRRRENEKDETSDYKSRSSMKEQRSRYADVENPPSHSRRRSSPSGSSYPTRDQHRLSKQEETKYRDYAYEDRTRHNVHSSRDYDSAPGQPDKRATPKDGDHMGGDLAFEKRPRPESRSSPQIDKSPSSISNERRNLIKSDTRKSLDLEEPGPRSGVSKDNIKDVKGSRELVSDTHPANDASQVENDNLSASSPYTRNAHFSGNSKSLRPPPSPSITEDGKSNNRHRRMVDQNMNRGQSHGQSQGQGQGQGQGNWNNVPNWASPMGTGGYLPFQHVPQPMFHPLMQQFPPQFFGRPPMKLNPGLPYHLPDHGPPPVHGWDANNAVFGDESHLYNRLDWDRRTQLNNQGWDQTGAGMEVLSGQQKDGHSGHRSNDENWSGQTARSEEGERNQPDILPETPNLDKNGPEAQKVTESLQIVEGVKEDNTALISQAYLSRVDVSKDLIEPELYEQCTSMMDLDQEALSDEFDGKILFLEEAVDTGVTDNASLFGIIDDSVFQKAMFLYKKQKEELHLMKTTEEKGGSDDAKSADEVAAEVTVMEEVKEADKPPNEPEEPVSMEVDRRVIKEEEEHESSVVPVKESLEEHESTVVTVKENLEEHEPTLVTVEESLGGISTADEKNGGGLLASTGDVSTADEKNGGGLLVSTADENTGDGLLASPGDVSTADEKTGGGLLASTGDVSSVEALVVIPTESVESGSVNLNRIHHHSAESTH